MGKRFVDVHKACSSRVTPGEYGRIGCAGRNRIEKRDELQEDTFLMVVNLVEVRLFKICDDSGSEVGIV